MLPSQNYMSKKFVIHLIGPSCVGKSAVEKVLQKKIKGVYSISFDKQKWLLSGYNRDTDRPAVKKICLGLMETVCRLGMPVFLNMPLTTEEKYNRFKKIAHRYGYAFFSFKLTAPKKVLLERFRKRMESFKKSGDRMSVTNEEMHRANFAKRFFIPKGADSYNTAAQTPEAIAEKIMAKLATAL